jgi:PadR family transcriptional regulator AphA
MLKHALLGFLIRAPMTGYDLERWIRRSIDYFWPAQLSQIYRTLRQLEDDGLVTSTVEAQQARPDRRVYAATEAGRRAFDEWLAELVTERDLVRVPFLVRFFFYGTRPIDEVITQLRVLREIYSNEVDRYTDEIPRTISEAVGQFDHEELDPVYWDSVRRAGELYVQMWLTWLSETIERLEAAQDRDQPA